MKSPTENMRKVTEQILSQRDLYDILPFGKTKVQQLIASGELPLVKVGKDYITTFSLLEKWIQQNIGEEIYY
ncbi:MAG: helix-turn-helix domain-containing protein [Clostridiales bacterium]|nr:helix-turn-helix domain-containing protein [Clostridiales bacterium]